MQTIFSRNGWLLFGVVAWTLCGPRAGRAATTNVSIGSNFFNPANVTINVNDTVMWTWNGGTHTTTSTSVPSLWDSGARSFGSTFSRQFTAAGSFPYRCTIHAGQSGTVNVQGPNTPPLVNVTSPTNGAVFTAPASFTFAATASDPGGNVTNVQFLRGTTLLTNDTSSPYSVSVSNLTAGNYTLSAVASDNGGLRATNSVLITVNDRPTVGIDSPTNGAIFAAPFDGMIQVTAADSDGTIARVDFLSGAMTLGSVSNAPFNLMVTNMTAGMHALRAVATDDRGATNTSTVINLSIVTPVPILLRGMHWSSSTQFVLSYSANVGLRYEVRRGATLADWTAIGTNTADANPMTITDNSATNRMNFYQIRRLPNP